MLGQQCLRISVLKINGQENGIDFQRLWLQHSSIFVSSIWNYQLSFSHSLWKFRYFLSIPPWNSVLLIRVMCQPYGISTLLFPGNSTILNRGIQILMEKPNAGHTQNLFKVI